MGLIWTNAVLSLKSLIQETEKYFSTNTNLTEFVGKKSKKRKIEDSENSLAGQNVVSELVLRSEFILESVKMSCMYDTDGFIDEVRIIRFIYHN